MLNLSFANSPSLSWVLFKIHWRSVLVSGLLKLSMDLATACGPFIVEQLVQYVERPEFSIEWGLFLVFALFFKAIYESFSYNHHIHMITKTGIRIRTSLINLIYKKSLRLSTSSRRDASVGEIVNLMQVNTQIFVELAATFHNIVSAPFQIILSVISLWLFIGEAAFIAFAVMILLIPFISLLSVFQNNTESVKIEIKDNRLKLINDILNGMKVLKYYGWELSFKKIINKIREVELKILKRYNILYGVSAFTYSFASFLVQVVAFVAYLFFSDKNYLDASVAFVCLTLFNMIKTPLYYLPLLISNLVQVKFF